MGVRQIGLSLGADICWPAAFEDLLERLDLEIEHEGERITFAAERVTIEPYDLSYKPKYHVVLDRLTHWYPIAREWIKKICLMDGVYVLNNPWSIQSMEKHTSYCAMLRLGLPIPKTWMLPAKEYSTEGDTTVTVEKYNRLFDLAEVGDDVGYPAFLKPYDGGAWVGVQKVDNAKELHAAYDKSGPRVNHLQEGVKDWDVFVRSIGIGAQFNVLRYDPTAPLHKRYVVDFHFLDGDEWEEAVKIGRVINAFFGWDFNSCELLRSNSTLFPIDFANPCPDSQITSLHFHFPWIVTSLLRWSIYCATIKRKPCLNLNWQAYFDIAELDIPFSEKLDRYDAIARDYFDTDAFEAFNEKHLQGLDAIALEYFGTDRFREITREKVTALFPAHEVDAFTEHFFGLVQFWRKTESDRLGLS